MRPRWLFQDLPASTANARITDGRSCRGRASGEAATAAHSPSSAESFVGDALRPTVRRREATKTARPACAATTARLSAESHMTNSPGVSWVVVPPVGREAANDFASTVNRLDGDVTARHEKPRDRIRSAEHGIAAPPSAVEAAPAAEHPPRRASHHSRHRRRGEMHGMEARGADDASWPLVPAARAVCGCRSRTGKEEKHSSERSMPAPGTHSPGIKVVGRTSTDTPHRTESGAPAGMIPHWRRWGSEHAGEESPEGRAISAMLIGRLGLASICTVQPHPSSTYSTCMHMDTYGASMARRTVQGPTAQHSAAQLSTAQRSKAQHGTAQHSTAKHSTTKHSMAQQSIAKHSKAQQSTAKHSKAQQSTAKHSKAQQSTAKHSTAKQSKAQQAQHSTAQQSTAKHSKAQQSTAKYSTSRHGTALHSMAQSSTAQHGTVQAQHSTVQHGTARYGAAQCASSTPVVREHTKLLRSRPLLAEPSGRMPTLFGASSTSKHATRPMTTSRDCQVPGPRHPSPAWGTSNPCSSPFHAPPPCGWPRKPLSALSTNRQRPSLRRAAGGERTCLHRAALHLPSRSVPVTQAAWPSALLTPSIPPRPLLAQPRTRR
ncbi:hypothetical protein DCS_07077 [Drechmeria coniospora]|uniref:Uncharacterized protein n=1 Tax=Drechmeria coniospora TaxID=98403 RepID=A0A151GDG0_DRECN|nr:hypothetical protein DCS_07077 [Drechmeria coniospora]KYK55115.1 hypothetical protein DCS_07077 [Drechmeria coniospora]